MKAVDKLLYMLHQLCTSNGRSVLGIVFFAVLWSPTKYTGFLRFSKIDVVEMPSLAAATRHQRRRSADLPRCLARRVGILWVVVYR